jgi:Putative Actinobacterial Holin-X, holin superfamily III
MPMSALLRNPIESIREIRTHGERAVRLAIELKTIELRGRAIRLGVAAGLGLVALLIAPLLIVFLLAAAAAALSTVVHVWLAILIVAAVLLLVIGGLLLVAAVLAKGALEGGERAEGR